MDNTRFWDEMAIQSFQTILKQNPNQPKIHCHLGLAYIRVQKSSKAIRSFLRAIKCDKKYADAYYHLGKTYLAENKDIEAYRCFKNYTKLMNDKPGQANEVVQSLIEELALKKANA